jgi:hypothetical protein
MPRILLASLLSLLLLPAPGSAQEADWAYFDSFEGLQRVIARSWNAPVPEIVPPGATPVATPGATPVASPGATPMAAIQPITVSIFVFLFETDTTATMGWGRLDNDLQDLARSDPNAPMDEALPLDGIGDRAKGYSGTLEIPGQAMTFTFATIQDGPFVYSISAMFAAGDAAGATRAIAADLAGARMDRMAERFDPAGGSTGGLWRKLNAVEPGMPEGAAVTDFVIYPPEATPVARHVWHHSA